MQSADLAGYFNQFGALELGHGVVGPLKTQYIPTGDNRKPPADYQGWNPSLSAIFLLTPNGTIGWAGKAPLP